MQGSKPYVPPFLAKAGLKPGEWMQISKLTVGVLCRPNMELKVRILGALMLQAFGYEEELAVVMAKDRFREKTVTSGITPQGIANVLNRATIAELKASGTVLPEELKAAVRISRQQIRKALAEMEDDGLILRARSNGPTTKLAGVSLHEAIERGLITPLADLSELAKKKLGTNAVCVYLLAKPKPAKSYHDYVVNLDYLNAAKSFKSDLTGSKQFYFRFTRDLALAEALATSDEGQQIYQGIVTAKEHVKQAEQVAKEFAQRKQIRPQNPPPIEAPDPQVPLFPAPPAAPPEKASAATVSDRHASGDPTKGGDSAPRVSPKRPKTTEELAPIAAVLTRWIDLAEQGKAWIGGALIFDDVFLKKLFGACRDAAPDCTPEEVAHFADNRLAIKRGKQVANPYGYLMAAVPQAFEGDALQRLRSKGDDQRKEPPAAVAQCSQCEGSGLIGLKLGTGEMTVGEWAERAGEAVRDHGAQYCECPEGETTRMLVEPARMRRSAS